MHAASAGPEGDRLLIIGWDGADWEILDDLIERGRLPNVARMVAEGARGDLASTLPSHSWAAWSSFLTGRNPGEHGVFDFVERHPSQPGKRIPASSASLKCGSFLESLSAAGKEVRAGNIPLTFPPFPVNGRMISGVAIPPGSEFVYPGHWRRELRGKAPFPINGMEWVRFKEDPFALVDEARRFVEQRTASFELLLEGRWDVGICVYLAPDRLQHPFGAYLLPTHPRWAELAESELAEAVRNVYTLLDHQVAHLAGLAGPNATIVLMSDHGFRPINRICDLDKVLLELGLMARARSADATGALSRSPAVRALLKTRVGRAAKSRIRKPSATQWSGSTAYQSAMGGGVSVNLKGREPSGTVEPADHERVKEDIRKALLSFEDPVTGGRPIAEVIGREDLYNGPYVDLAPDLLARSADLFSLGPAPAVTVDTDWPSGAHRRNGIILAAGGRTVAGELGQRDIRDLPATALGFAGISDPSMEGRSIEEIAGSPVDKPVVADAESRHSVDDLSEADQESIAKHLRDLGYIE
ncbi:MAG: alkaline phosphatase family protein [Actinomycetota bacterium]|nr:alkaline phosphatase family protein [Actinomycetota bacterium]